MTSFGSTAWSCGPVSGSSMAAGDKLTHLHIADSFNHKGATICVFAWEERAVESSTYMLERVTKELAG